MKSLGRGLGGFRGDSNLGVWHDNWVPNSSFRFKAPSLLKMKLFGLRMFLVLKDGIGLEYPLSCQARSLY